MGTVGLYDLCSSLCFFIHVSKKKQKHIESWLTKAWHLCHPSTISTRAPGRSYAHDAAAIGRWPRSPGWSEPAASEGLMDPMGFFLGGKPTGKARWNKWYIHIIYISTYMEVSMRNIYHTHITYRCVSHHHLMIVMWWLMMTQATSLRAVPLCLSLNHVPRQSDSAEMSKCTFTVLIDVQECGLTAKKNVDSWLHCSSLELP